MVRTACPVVFEVNISRRDIDGFAELVGAERVRAVKQTAEDIRGKLGCRAIWNVNSTPVGGGVAEMLRSLLRYARGLGIDVRWAVIEGPPDFFRITKRVHNALHGSTGDGSPLGPAQAELYERVLRDNALAIDALVRPGDVVVCHDPQTAGLVPHLMKKGALVVWRCHIGHERHDVEEDRGWGFLRPYLQDVRYAVFSRADYVPAWLRGRRATVVPPNIDPFSAKNRTIEPEAVRAILAEVGLIDLPAEPGQAVFTRDDGSTGRVDRKAEVVRLGRPTAPDVPLVVQVSRWDRMKDPLGVMQGFGRLVDPLPPRGAELVIAGPSVGTVADDPEATEVFSELHRAWRDLPDALRQPVHLATLPMQDAEENAAIVNALQRHAAIIVQKSLHEGFGLTVTEAMWKRRPVVASAVGGIQDQIHDGVDGLLLPDPTDLDAFAAALARVLLDEPLAHRLGDAAYECVRDNYLSITALARWAELLEELLG